MFRSLIVPLLAFACCAQDQRPVYKLLYSSQNPNLPGGLPVNLFEVQPGLFYGLSASTGVSGAVIFSLTGDGTFKVVYNFSPANNNLVESLVQATNGRLYGGGGSITAGNYYFSISTAGSDLQQYPFPGKWGPLFQTLVTPTGKLYDLALAGLGNLAAYGLASIDESGQVTILHQFSSAEGVPNPNGSIVYATDGNIYGFGSQGPYSGDGPSLIYRMTPAGAYSQLLSLGTFTGSGPLVAGSDGNLYNAFEGSMRSHGPHTTGAIFQTTLSGQGQVISNFPPKGMHQPVSLMQAADGDLYGSTNTFSYIFRYDFAQNKLSQVYSLPEATCYCYLIEGMDGKLYGVGRNYTIFSLDIGLPRPTPVIAGLYPSSGPVGQEVILWGNYLLGPTSVTFNGVPAADPVATSVRSVSVTVPAGATTGPVSITTANGTFTTTQNFTVE